MCLDMEKDEVTMIKIGDLVFMRSNTFMGWAIRTVSTGRLKSTAPNHVAIVTGVTPDEVILLEAGFKGVALTTLKAYDKQKVWIKRMKEPRNIPKGIEWALGQQSKGYDFTALLGILCRSSVRLLGPKVYNKVRGFRNLLNSRTRFLCSELASKYGAMTGKPLWDADFSVTTPFDLIRSPLLEDVKEKV